ncbi:MAG: alpha-amylase family glycosyl hydrolase [Spirochaetes bacterium]|nr:alpha-amylase family glycosyl hydrolase [Spirochaetota bacterium]
MNKKVILIILVFFLKLSIFAANGPGQLGAKYTPEETTFSIWSPDTSNVVLLLDGVEYPCSRISDFDGYTDIYSVTVSGDRKDQVYQFKINGQSVRDPYGVMLSEAESNFNVVMDLEETNPDNGWYDRPDLVEREDAVIYEIHIRDFTIDENSGIPTDKKGKFLGMVHSGSTYNGLTTGIDHLIELGVTHVQILPFYDFATRHYNWGYDPANYNIPEDQYVSDPDDSVKRIKELKTMINEFHNAGIRVIMDVVYNHTYMPLEKDGPIPEYLQDYIDVFEPITRDYYLTDSNGDLIDLSGCANTLDTQNAMVNRFIRDSLEYWVEEFHIDGFRFDLFGTMMYQAVDEWADYLNSQFADANLLIYGEPWQGTGDNTLGSNKVRLGKMPLLADSHVGAFNDQFRQAIKGSSDNGDWNGYMCNESDAYGVEQGIRGSLLEVKSKTAVDDWSDRFAYDPEQTINYAAAHDNLCLWDKLIAAGHEDNYGKRIVKFVNGILMTSQGIPFIHAGDEMLRTKLGDDANWEYAENSYKAPDEYNKIRWQWKESNLEVFEYIKALISLRKSHPGLRFNTWDEINNNMTTEVVNNGKVIISQINAAANNDQWSKILVIYNSDNNYWYQLPSGNWYIAVEKENGNANDILAGEWVEVEGTSITVLYQLQEEWEQAYLRSTENNWGTTNMEKVGPNTWEATVTFTDTGDNPPRFKIDHYGDWTESYPSVDYVVEANQTYKITFHDITKEVNAELVDPVTSVTIYYSEFEYASSYILHCWNGLSEDYTMTYDGPFNNIHWWKITLANVPANFNFCFTNSNGNWDGVNRLYSEQGEHLYIYYGDSTVYTSR